MKHREKYLRGEGKWEKGTRWDIEVAVDFFVY
jgi:hypothetical protein